MSHRPFEVAGAGGAAGKEDVELVSNERLRYTDRFDDRTCPARSASR
jgi:hypothetical protein